MLIATFLLTKRDRWSKTRSLTNPHKLFSMNSVTNILLSTRERHFVSVSLKFQLIDSWLEKKNSWNQIRGYDMLSVLISWFSLEISDIFLICNLLNRLDRTDFVIKCSTLEWNPEPIQTIVCFWKIVDLEFKISNFSSETTL